MIDVPPLPLPKWEIYVGNVFLYIVGPGPTAMRRCSRRNLNPGTPDEWALARRALEILKVRHYNNKEAGEAEILAALVECGYEEET